MHGPQRINQGRKNMRVSFWLVSSTILKDTFRLPRDRESRFVPGTAALVDLRPGWAVILVVN
jgi:hypothetical protein